MKIKRLLMAVLMMCGLMVGMVPQLAWADSGSICNDPEISEDLKEAAGCSENIKTVDEVANGVIKIVIAIIGVIAVGVMIYGGFCFMMSHGDAARVQKGKHIIMYGLIGLIVSIMAYAIVLFVSGMLSSNP